MADGSQALASFDRATVARFDRLNRELGTQLGTSAEDGFQADRVFQGELATFSGVLDGIPDGQSLVRISPGGSPLSEALDGIGSDLSLQIGRVQEMADQARSGGWQFRPGEGSGVFGEVVAGIDAARARLAGIRPRIDDEVSRLNVQSGTAVEDANRMMARLREIRENAKAATCSLRL